MIKDGGRVMLNHRIESRGRMHSFKLSRGNINWWSEAFDFQCNMVRKKHIKIGTTFWENRSCDTYQNAKLRYIPDEDKFAIFNNLDQAISPSFTC